jgi:single-strand DNA-binding protein
MNKVFIIGRLVKDAELKYTANGTAVSRFSVACNEKRRADGDASGDWVDEVNYFDAVLWGKTAESLDQYLVKGKRIAIDGKLKQDRWQDRDTGNNRSRISITALNIQLLDSGNAAGENGGGTAGYTKNGYGNSEYSGYGSSPGSRSAPRRSADKPVPPRPSAPAPADDDGFVDDIPF